MRIAAFVGVKDEVELIGGAVENLRRIGVNGIAVADMGSTDGTLDILKAFEHDDDFLLLHYSDLDLAFSSPEAPQFRQFLARFNPERVMLSDADERWVPEGSSIQDVAGLEENDILIVSRFNVPLSAKGLARSLSLGVDQSRDFDVVASGPLDIEQSRASHPDVPTILFEMWPRVIFRPDVAHEFDAGFHGIRPIPGATARLDVAKDIFVAHLPFTTRARYRRKLANIRSYIVRSAPLAEKGDAGHGWRRLSQVSESPDPDEEFECQFLTPEQLASLRSEDRVLSTSKVFASSKCGAGLLPAFMLAQHLRRLERLDEAVTTLRAIIQASGDFVQAHWVLVDILTRNDRLDEAEAALSYAMELSANNTLLADALVFLSWAHSELAQRWMKHGKLKRAEQLVRKAVDLRPLTPWLRLHSEVLMRLNRLDESIMAVELAIAKTPENGEYHAHRSVLLFRRGRLAEADVAIKQALALGPASAEYLFRHSQILLRLGRLDESVAAVELALAAAPENPEYFGHLALLLLRSEKAAEAEAAIRRAIALAPANAEYLLRHSRILRKLNDLDQALGAAEEALALSSTSLDCRIEVSSILLEMGRLGDAEARTREAIVLHPNEARFFLQLSRVLKRSNRFEEATSAERSAATLQSQHAQSGLASNTGRRSDRAAS